MSFSILNTTSFWDNSLTVLDIGEAVAEAGGPGDGGSGPEGKWAGMGLVVAAVAVVCVG